VRGAGWQSVLGGPWRPPALCPPHWCSGSRQGWGGVTWHQWWTPVWFGQRRAPGRPRGCCGSLRLPELGRDPGTQPGAVLGSPRVPGAGDQPQPEGPASLLSCSFSGRLRGDHQLRGAHGEPRRPPSSLATPAPRQPSLLQPIVQVQPSWF